MSTKTKLVYRQDPDGIFRLKKIDNEDIAGETDRFLSNHRNQQLQLPPPHDNELADCSYQLDQTAIPTSNSSMKILGDSDSKRSIESPQTSLSSSSSIFDSGGPQTLTFARSKSTSHPKSNQSKNNQDSVASFDSMNSNRLPSVFHLPSFLLGILLSIFSVFFKYQVIQLFGVSLILFVLGSITTVIFSGLQSYQDFLLSYVSIVKTQFAFFPSSGKNPPCINDLSDKHEDESELEQDQESLQSKETRSTQNSDNFTHYQMNFRPHSINSIPNKDRSKDPSSPFADDLSSAPYPAQETVEMKLIMHPPRTDDYIPQPHGKDIIPKSRLTYKTSHSSPSIQLHQRQSKLLRFNKNREGSLPLPEPSYSPTREFPKIVKIHNKLQKELPTPPLHHQDLPLINPLPRSRHQSFDDHQYSKIIHKPIENQFNGIVRNDTVKSTKSVLGTSANYNKFLANANEHSPF
jgi:hypothetical protein